MAGGALRRGSGGGTTVGGGGGVPVAAAPRRIPRAVSVPVLPSIASPSSPAPTDARTPRAAEPLAVGAALESPATNGSWLALMLPAIGGAVVLGLIAAGFATRRGLSKVD